MAKILTIVALMIAAATAQAEVNYNFKNPDHVADKECIAVYSVARDNLFSNPNPTADVVKVRNAITELQNILILKYAYSKQLGTHVDAHKFLINQRINEQGAEYLVKSVNECSKNG